MRTGVWAARNIVVKTLTKTFGRSPRKQKEPREIEKQKLRRNVMKDWQAYMSCPPLQLLCTGYHLALSTQQFSNM